MMAKHEPRAIEDIMAYWMNQVLDRVDEPFSDQDTVHCQLFALLYIGHSLDAIDNRLMHMETLMKGIYDQKEESKFSWNSLMRKINDRWRNRHAKQ